jgi:hypothetical protein
MPVQDSVQNLYGIVYRSVRDFVQRTISILYIISLEDNNRAWVLVSGIERPFGILAQFIELVNQASGDHH